MKSLKFLLCLLLLQAVVTGSLSAQNRTSPTNNSRNPVDTTKRKKEASLADQIAKALLDDRKRIDSLDLYYRNNPQPTHTYVETWLITQQVLPTEDAIDIIKALNPSIRNLSEINRYVVLKMPVFKNVHKADRKRLRKERKKLGKYDPATQDNLVGKIRDFQSAYSQYKTSKIVFGNTDARNEFNNDLSDINGYLDIYSRKRLAKGISVTLTNEITLLNKVLNDVYDKRSAVKVPSQLLYNIKADLYYESLLKGTQYELFSKEDINKNTDNRGLAFENSISAYSNGETVSFDQYAAAPFYVSDEDLSSKMCLIYAMSPPASGNPKDATISGQYFYSFQSFGNAVYNCYADNCSGFIEAPYTISVSGANIVPAEYVFRFRSSKEPGKYYYRHITKESFERISATGKTKFKIIFNPDSKDDDDFRSF